MDGRRPNDVGSGTGNGSGGPPPVRPSVRSFVQAANGIDSIKRRGNEESEGEAAAVVCRPVSEGQGRRPRSKATTCFTKRCSEII